MTRRSVPAIWILVLALGWTLCAPRPGAAQKFDWQMYKGTTLRVLAPKNAAAMAIEPFIPDFEK
ncbi:MAG TPA: hypothetical protein VF579_12035, partial [Candidatus Methylomirabilis sp.]